MLQSHQSECGLDINPLKVGIGSQCRAVQLSTDTFVSYPLAFLLRKPPRSQPRLRRLDLQARRGPYVYGVCGLFLLL